MDSQSDSTAPTGGQAFPADALLSELISEQLASEDCVDLLHDRLRKFLGACSDAKAQIIRFQADPSSLTDLLQLFATSESLSKRVIETPESFELLRQGAGQRIDRDDLVDDLRQKIEGAKEPINAARIIHDFLQWETARIEYAQFVGNMVPERVGRQLSSIAEAVVKVGFDYCQQYFRQTRDEPQLPNGQSPRLVVIAVANLGAQEMSYGDALKLIFLYDRIDPWNRAHRDYYNDLITSFTEMLRGDHLYMVTGQRGLEIDFRENPKYETGTRICSVLDACRIFETSGRTWQRFGFIKARVIAGDFDVGLAFLKRLEPWVYRRFISREDMAEIHSLRHKLTRRTQAVSGPSVSTSPAKNESGTSTSDLAVVGSEEINILTAAGGRKDIERTVRFLQLLHGGSLPSVRVGNTYDAIISLEKAGCVTAQEASLLSKNHAQLCRLQHQLAVMFNDYNAVLPTNSVKTARLAWRLGLRDSANRCGDREKFFALLTDIFKLNRRIINHLMLNAPSDNPTDFPTVAVETELMLDPDPSPQLIDQTLSKHGFKHPRRAMEDLIALSTESVPFLSPHRCRHFFSLIAPVLLTEIARTPMPTRTLASLVAVSDSLGAKATLWELLSANRPTMQMMVRICAAAPYLDEILIHNPGMIDELIDSLLIDRLPSSERLDAQSIDLCRGAEDIDLILHSFKSSSHLTIGVRNLLGKELLGATQAAISDTAEACLRRIAAHEQERLSLQFGDPTAADGSAAELIIVGLGKLGGHEPNYHSDLDAVFLYTAEGETQRRVGGPRTTITNRSFFNQLAVRILNRIDAPGPNGRLYELDSRLKPIGAEGVQSETTDEFLARFKDATALPWHWLAICRARSITGSRKNRQQFNTSIKRVIATSAWNRTMTPQQLAAKLVELRIRIQETATAGNFKRGEGGTMDVEFITQALMLRFAAESTKILKQNTIEALEALADAGYLPEEESLQLIAGYQTLRSVELNLGLMNSLHRHELPEQDYRVQNLAFLMNENDPKMVTAACQQVRHRNRKLFERIFKRLAEKSLV